MMENKNSDIIGLVESLPSITLEEMSSIRLMNRTDEKYLTNRSTLKKLLELAQGSYYSQEVKGKRISPYRTTYWDTDQHLMYRLHQCGHSPRMKVRVRTYIDTETTFLEVKQKNNHGKTLKKRVEVNDASTPETEKSNRFLNDRIGLCFEDIHPALQNRFDRITLVNNEMTERLTIDFNLQFHNMETAEEASMRNLVVVELKRDGRNASPVHAMLRELRVKPSGFSKYCIGSYLTNQKLPGNNIKPKMVQINRLAN